MRWTLWVFVMALSAVMGAQAQTTPPPHNEGELRKLLVKKQFYLRNFSADEKITGHWSGGALVLDAPRFRSLSLTKVTSVKLKGNVLTIEGERKGVLRQSDTQLVTTPGFEKISVAIGFVGADLSSVWPTVADGLFFSDLKEATDNIPARYKTLVPGRVSVDLSQVKGATRKDCDCAEPSSTACRELGVYDHPGGLTLPKVKFAPEPEYSEQARKSKLSANIRVALTVDEVGRVQDIWVIRSGGGGLDIKASEAVSQYKFSPAQCHGVPQAKPLFIDVNFQIF